MISRRGILVGAAASGAALLTRSRSGVTEVRRFVTTLKIPPLLEGRSATEGKIYDLDVASGKSEFLSGSSTPTIGINSAYLGPTIRCRENDRVTLRVKNDLTEPTRCVPKT
jgi:FtsP/CotA-like multicopper oxidase with cupredoxin domain